MHGLGPIPREENEPVFHADWERRMYALGRQLLSARIFSLDEFRHAIERIPPSMYLGLRYYEKWVIAATGLLIEKGIIKPAELKGLAPIKLNPTFTVGGRPNEPISALGHGAAGIRPRFKPGGKVIAKNVNPAGHTRLPRYARGKRGVIVLDEGVFALPDAVAHGGGVIAQHVYAVRFAARELWGGEASPRESVTIDLWEAYLEPAKGLRVNGRSRNGSGRS